MNQIDSIAAENNIRVLGPAEAPIFKRGKLYRYQLLLKLELTAEPAFLFESISRFGRESKGVSVVLDVDPMTFL